MLLLRLTKAVLKINRCYSSLTSRRTTVSTYQRRLYHPNHTMSQIGKMSSELFDSNIHDDSDLKQMLEPYEYATKIQKQESRTSLIIGLNQWMNLPAEKLEAVVELFNLMYDYIMIFDDLLDDPEMRRGVPAVHKIYGNRRTMIACDGLIFLLLQKITALNNNEALRIFNEGMLRYYKGISYEVCWQLNSKCPTMNEYTYVIELKLTSLYYWIIQLMQSLSNCKKDFSTFVKLLGYYYQFLNDCCSVNEVKYWEAHGFAEDISEGKFSLPIIHAINSGTHEGDIVRNIILQKTKNVEMKRYCIYLLEKLGSLEYVNQIVQDTELQLREEIDRLGGNKTLHEMVDAMRDWKNDEIVIDRNTTQ